MAWALLSLLMYLNVGHALDFKSLKVGMAVELNQNISVNTLKSGAGMLCRVGEKGIYPKIIMGPLEGANANVRYFTVDSLMTDMGGYQVKLVSDQMPCDCVLWLMQWFPYFEGAGSDFKMLIPADVQAMREVPPIDSSCKNDPEWKKKIDLMAGLNI